MFDCSKLSEPPYVLSSRAAAPGAPWLPPAPAHFARWAATAPALLLGPVGEAVVLVRFNSDPEAGSARRQAEEAAAAASGHASSVELVVLATESDEERDAVLGEDAGDGAGAWAGAAVCAVTMTAGQLRSHQANVTARVRRHRILNDPASALDVALRCAYASEDVGQAAALNTIYASLPTRTARLGRLVDPAAFEALQERADELDRHLAANEAMERHGAARPMAWFARAVVGRDEEACMGVVRGMCRAHVRHGARDERGWRRLQDDLLGAPSAQNPHGGVTRCAFDFLAEERVTETFLEALLDAACFDLAREAMQVEIDRAAARGGFSLSRCVRLVLRVARENADSASSTADVAWANAEACLDLIPDEEGDEDGGGDEDEGGTGAAGGGGERAVGAAEDWWEEAEAERRLARGIVRLAEMGLDPLPVQVRQAADRATVIAGAVAERRELLCDSTGLLEVASLLGLRSDGEQQRVREILARAALQDTGTGAADGAMVSEALHLVGMLMRAGRESAWDLAATLAEERSLEVAERARCAAYALAHCPASQTPRALAVWREVCAAEGESSAVALEDHGGLHGPQAEWLGDDALADGPWGRAPRGGALPHAFYAAHMPGRAAPRLDPYANPSGSDQEVDVEAASLQEHLAEGVTLVARLRRTDAALVVQDAALCKLTALGAQADALITLAAAAASTPADALAALRHSAAAVAGRAEAAGSRHGGAAVAACANTAWLGSLLCTLILSGRAPNAPLLSASLAEACAAMETLPQAGSIQTKLVSAMSAARVGKKVEGENEDAAWIALRDYFDTLRGCLEGDGCCVTASEPWTVVALIDGGEQTKAILRRTVTDANFAQVANAAKKLTVALPDAECLATEVVKATLLAKTLIASGDASSISIKAVLREADRDTCKRVARELNDWKGQEAADISNSVLQHLLSIPSADKGQAASKPPTATRGSLEASAVGAVRKEAKEKEAARKNAEAEAEAARKKAEAEADAEAEAARKKAEAEAEAARKKAEEEEAARKKADEEEAARKRAEKEAEAARQKAEAEAEAARKKAEAEAEAARQKAEDEDAARQKAEEEEAARKKAEAARREAKAKEAARKKADAEAEAARKKAEAEAGGSSPEGRRGEGCT